MRWFPDRRASSNASSARRRRSSNPGPTLSSIARLHSSSAWCTRSSGGITASAACSISMRSSSSPCESAYVPRVLVSVACTRRSTRPSSRAIRDASRSDPRNVAMPARRWAVPSRSRISARSTQSPSLPPGRSPPGDRSPRRTSARGLELERRIGLVPGEASVSHDASLLGGSEHRRLQRGGRASPRHTRGSPRAARPSGRAAEPGAASTARRRPRRERARMKRYSSVVPTCSTRRWRVARSRASRKRPSRSSTCSRTRASNRTPAIAASPSSRDVVVADGTDPTEHDVAQRLGKAQPRPPDSLGSSGRRHAGGGLPRRGGRAAG